ncbi:phage tail protein [Providencia rettgeri]|uniref:Phage tail protein n=1 Tax=Providencia rettgeri TaxID=587 RepID=A0A264VZP8_PRORE|nr:MULTISPECIES: putative phage tail protein [Providencia]MBQ0533479.1 DUF2313 domain-containing protein [Providencia huaxiensis]MBQ0587036.1 DUF2313 domain-containing protein [Providencia huaxiensis]MDI7238282.1 DUF2313 domain-containing protein [Providencia huaxiensis]OZS76287.1 phage tail protein [Providencia rettgeri]
MIPYSVDDYTQALVSLAPQGRAWNLKPNTVMNYVLRGLAQTYHRSDVDAIKLLEEAFPKTVNSMLPEWEKTLGLPDGCSLHETSNLAKRQNAVVSKLISTNGQSKFFFIRYAEMMGYIVTITEFRTARCGLSFCGDPINGEDWPFVWRVNAGESTVRYALSGTSQSGDPLRSWGDRYIECKLKTLTPSHTILHVSYTTS